MGEEGSNVDHGNGLQGDTRKQSALATDDIDQEQRTADSSDELDDTEDGGDEKGLVLALDTEDLEEIRSVEGDGAGAGPLGEELDHGCEVETVQVAGDEEELLDLTKPGGALGGLELLLVRMLDGVDLTGNVLVVDGEVTEVSHSLGGLLDLALLNEEAGGLELEEGQDEDDAGEHDV